MIQGGSRSRRILIARRRRAPDDTQIGLTQWVRLSHRDQRRSETAKMRAMVVGERGGRFVAEQRDIPVPGPEEMRIRVQACGVCHSDVVTVQGPFPIVQYPHVPGHEVIGVVDALGEGVHGWKVGSRAGVGWFGGSCGYAANAGATMRSFARMCTNQRRHSRRRLRHSHDRPRLGGGACPGRSRRSRICASAMRGRHHL